MKLRIFLIIICSLFIVMGVSIKINNYYKKYKVNNDDIKSVSNYLLNNYKDYIGILEIPKINFKKGIKDNTNVDNGIAILDIDKYNNGDIILLSHSGNCDVCYFNRLDELSYNDQIFIYKDNIKYIYKVDSIEEKIKNTFKLEDSTNSVTLITCKKNTDNIQIIIKSKLYKQEKY